MNPNLPLPKRLIPGVARIVAVASGKGGVGKTTTAVHLALALQRNGARVGIYDADLYGPNVPLMLGVRRKESAARIDPSGMIPTVRANPKPYIPPLERYGLQVMSIGLLMGGDAAITPDPRTAGDIIRQTLQDVQWDGLDYLVLDLPPGTGEPHQTLLRTIHIDGVVIVTTPQELSLMDAERSLRFFQDAGVTILGVVENMSYLHCPHCGEPVEIFPRRNEPKLLYTEEIELLGRIPINSDLSRTIDSTHPLVQSAPDTAEVRLFLEMASTIAGRFR